MLVTFSDKDLERCADDEKYCIKKLGARRAKIFNTRISYLKTSENLEAVRYLPGKFHELVENRKGQWACDLDQPYRLIFVPHENPIPTDANGKYLWIEIKGVEVLEITNYHGK